MRQNRGYVAWLATSCLGAGVLVGLGGIASTGAVPLASPVSAVVGCRGNVFVTRGGSKLCLPSAPFVTDPSVLVPERRLPSDVTPAQMRKAYDDFVARHRSAAGRVVIVPQAGVPGLLVDPQRISLRSGISYLQTQNDGPCPAPATQSF